MKSIKMITGVMLIIGSIAFGRGAASSDEKSEGAESMMQPPEAAGEAMMMESAPVMMSSGGKSSFTNLEDARMLAASGPTVLFFHADWCPLCRIDMRQIDARLSELDNIAVVIVDYDRFPDLKKKYGITYQHTYVQIDEDGEKIALWSGGGVDGILENIIQGGEVGS